MQNHGANTALAALTAACLMQQACLGDELVQGRVAVVGAIPQALMSGELVAVDGSYSGYSIADSGWRYVVWTWGGVNTIVYVDGVVRDGPVAHSGANTVGNAGRIGNAYWAARNLTGKLDELRVITSVRNQPWITTEYNNQRPNSTFIKSVGAEQLVP